VGVKFNALPETSEIARAKHLLEITTKRQDERFVTGLLWNTDEVVFPDSYPMAVKCLQSLERKLSHDPELRQNVHQQVQQYLDMGFAHKATEQEINGCEARHNALLHLPSATRCAEVLAHNGTTKSGVLFRIVPVVVHYGPKSVETLALLDEGSSLTLMETSLANTLGVSGRPEPLELSWTADVTRKENASQRVDVQISARGDDRRYELSAARTVEKLSLPKQELNRKILINNFSHFQKLPIPSFLKAEPKLLIGLQHMELLTLT
uniref:Peptidase A2 domain-containing protein n=1 Tax=Anopheles quadriannulatus TaxID=34691 RepID=A0A182XQ40_ANOQN